MADAMLDEYIVNTLANRIAKNVVVRLLGEINPAEVITQTSIDLPGLEGVVLDAIERRAGQILKNSDIYLEQRYYDDAPVAPVDVARP